MRSDALERRHAGIGGKVRCTVYSMQRRTARVEHCVGGVGEGQVGARVRGELDCQFRAEFYARNGIHGASMAYPSPSLMVLPLPLHVVGTGIIKLWYEI